MAKQIGEHSDKIARFQWKNDIYTFLLCLACLVYWHEVLFMEWQQLWKKNMLAPTKAIEQHI